MQDAKQLQELLKESIQHINNICSAPHTAPVSDRLDLFISAAKFADRALPFATLEVKPHE